MSNLFVSLLLIGASLAMSPSSFAVQASCISYQDAMNLSEAYPAVDESQLPQLSAGWTWQKEYSASTANPDAWQWVSWPDGTTLQICSQN